MSKLAKAKPRVVLTHGEDKPRKELARKLSSTYGLKAEFPGLGDVITL